MNNIRRNYWLLRQNGGRTTTTSTNNNSNNTSRRLRLQFKRKSYADFQKTRMPTTSFTDNYRVNPMKIKRFICHCCSAVFRLSSRLRVHYLFQHGHIPESLGGLSPRPNETVINCEWNQSSQENINDKNNDKSERTSATTTNNNTNTTDNKSESNQLSTQDNVNMSTTTPIEAVVTGHTTLASSSSSSNMLNVSELNSIYLNTRNRKRKVVTGNNNIDSTDSTACTTATTTVRSCRRTKKSMNDITNQNGRNSRSKDLFSQDLTTDNNEIDQMISGENLSLKTRHYCPECDITFAKSFNLKRHESIIHRREYRYFCGYCEFRTGQHLAYEEHLARHFNVKQFVCEVSLHYYFYVVFFCICFC
ncbi:unnamed protein product [Trichobilharzia regenti]|nr:unnamed protein product [Trichobilharzia regenti]